MKKLTLIVSAFALLIGFSQCKKEEITPNNNDNRIQITLNANYGGNSKTTFDPADGTFDWLHGYGTAKTEYINVGGSVSGYLGQLNNSAAQGTGTFTGDITTPESGETLYFFYLGNGNHEDATTLDFSNQSNSTVTDYHIAIGSATYDPEASAFNATLNMAMAIAYFDLSEFGSETVTLFGNDVYSTATIDYNNGTITGAAKGNINLGTASNEKYVALIPSVNNETVLQFDSDSKTGIMRFLRGIKPASFYSNNKEALPVTANDLFSVSAGTKVRFSRGNLQYTRESLSDDWSTGTWSFKTNQYDMDATGSVGTNYSERTVVSHFGFGTSGHDSKYPYNTSAGVSQSIENTDYDWGVKNSSSIINGGKFNGWRTLTSTEWGYLLNTRSVTNSLSPNARYTLATIEGEYKGMIIFPDNYSHPTDVNITNATYNNASDYSATISSLDDWKKMETAGAVFLPAAGIRSGASIVPSKRIVATQEYYIQGGYWSSSYSSSSGRRMEFNGYQNSFNYGASVYNGSSVRLVRE